MIERTTKPKPSPPAMMCARSALLQRKCARGGTPGSTGECEKCRKKKLQRKTRSAEPGSQNGSFAPDIVHQVLRSPGRPLDPATRAFMEPRFGHDFSHVRVHIDANAAESARAVNARAYTVGYNVVFGNGQYRSDNSDGRRLLAHELTHVVQQRAQPAPPAGDLAINSPDDSSEREADAAARDMLAARSTIAVSTNAGARLQRDDFEPWPGQKGTGVPGTVKKEGSVASEKVQRTGDPNYTASMPIALEFDESNCTVTSRMEINFIPAGKKEDRLTDERFTKLKTRIITVANEKLNGWMHVQVGEDKACSACSGKTIKINVVAAEGSGPGAATVMLRGGTGRANAGTILEGGDDWFTSLLGGVSDGTLWHESGHIVLGLPDEYPPAPGDPARPANRISTGDWSVMSEESAYGRRSVMLPRHFSFLTEWLGRRYPACKFALVAEPIPVTIDVVAGATVGASAISGGWGLTEAADLAVGIPLDQQRRFRALVGAYGGFISTLKPQSREAFMAGGLVGLDYSTNRSGGGFAVRGDFRLGVGKFSKAPATVPTVGGNITLGYAGPRAELGATVGAGKFLGVAPQNDPYFTLGVRAALNF